MEAAKRTLLSLGADPSQTGSTETLPESFHDDQISNQNDHY